MTKYAHNPVQDQKVCEHLNHFSVFLFGFQRIPVSRHLIYTMTKSYVSLTLQ